MKISVLFAISMTPIVAHDMWIEPTAFSPAAGEIVGVRLRVGQDLLGDPLARDPKLVNQFVVVDSEGRKPLVGRDGGDPAGYLRVAGPGLHVVGYFSNPSVADLTADKFNQYLKEEGLDAIAAARAKRNETNSPVHEQFSRCAKSLVLSGPAAESQGDKALGFTLELVAERNPYTLHAGEELPVRLTYQNRPLEGTLVVAINRLNPASKQSARTDRAGRVKLKLPSNGMWMIKAVHTLPAAAGTNADWSSYWASLTFELKNVQNH